MDMRIIRGANGRGMGNMFLEKKFQINNEPVKDKSKVKLSSTIWINHYDEDPKIKKATIYRESIFQAYSKYFNKSDCELIKLGALSESFTTDKSPGKMSKSNCLIKLRQKRS
jgi:hypothetical protein